MPGVDPIVLRQPAQGLGELANSVGVDQADRQAGLAQGLGQSALVAAAGLQTDRFHFMALEPLDQLSPTGFVIADLELGALFAAP